MFAFYVRTLLKLCHKCMKDIDNLFTKLHRSFQKFYKEILNFLITFCEANSANKNQLKKTKYHFSFIGFSNTNIHFLRDRIISKVVNQSANKKSLNVQLISHYLTFSKCFHFHFTTHIGLKSFQLMSIKQQKKLLIL